MTCLEAAARHGCASCLALLCDAGAEPLAGPILHAQPRKTALMHAAGAFPVTIMRLSHKSTKQCKGTWQLWSCSAGGTLPASMRCAWATLHSIWQQRRASCRSWMSCCGTVRHVAAPVSSPQFTDTGAQCCGSSDTPQWVPVLQAAAAAGQTDAVGRLLRRDNNDGQAIAAQVCSNKTAFQDDHPLRCWLRSAPPSCSAVPWSLPQRVATCPSCACWAIPCQRRAPAPCCARPKGHWRLRLRMGSSRR